MNIPDEIRIGGHYFEVVKVPTYVRDTNKLGTFIASDIRLTIDSSMPKSMQNSTLIHEIIEAINYMYEIGLEHKQISALEAALHQVIVDNQEIFQ